MMPWLNLLALVLIICCTSPQHTQAQQSREGNKGQRTQFVLLHVKERSRLVDRKTIAFFFSPLKRSRKSFVVYIPKNLLRGSDAWLGGRFSPQNLRATIITMNSTSGLLATMELTATRQGKVASVATRQTSPEDGVLLRSLYGENSGLFPVWRDPRRKESSPCKYFSCLLASQPPQPDRGDNKRQLPVVRPRPDEDDEPDNNLACTKPEHCLGRVCIDGQCVPARGCEDCINLPEMCIPRQEPSAGEEDSGWE
ncbi:MAG: hypothetical protein RL326_1224, partial [Pseudomonadota bacterium]